MTVMVGVGGNGHFSAQNNLLAKWKWERGYPATSEDKNPKQRKREFCLSSFSEDESLEKTQAAFK